MVIGAARNALWDKPSDHKLDGEYLSFVLMICEADEWYY